MKLFIRSIARLALCTLMLSGILSRPASAQRLPATATGKTYLIAFPKAEENLFDPRFPNTLQDKVNLLLYSDRPTTVSVTTSGGTPITSVNLSGGESKEVEIPITASLFIDESGVVSDRVLRVSSRRPILLYCSMVTKYGAETWAPLPIESWGKEYYNAVLPAEKVEDVTPISEYNLTAQDKGAPSELIIIAARNNTTVTIYPVGKIAGTSSSNPISVRLDAGEAYIVQSQTMLDNDNAGNNDLGGMAVVSNKIIGVLSGNLRSSAGNTETSITGNSYKNMTIESLAPVDEHGTEFAFMPTWDSYRLLPSDAGTPGEGKRLAEYVRVYGSSAGTTYGTVTDDQGNLQLFNLAQTGVHEEAFTGLQGAHVVRTDQPSQVMMHPAAVVKFNGSTTYTGGLIGADYKTVSPYMVELTPREQWTTVAPFMAPLYPTSMSSYVNVVTRAEDQNSIYLSRDGNSSSPFLFNRGAIPGTDLVWGTMQIVPGGQYKLIGDNGARFGGFVYGTRPGYEIYRPGATKKDDKGSSTQSMHPSEYEEVLGLSYGYPLAPRRGVLNDPDTYTLQLEDEDETGEQTYQIGASNANPVGLRSIDMSPESVNAEVEVLDLTSGEADVELIGESAVRVRVYPVDPTQNASGSLVITDRTGNETALPYEYTASISGVSEHESAVSSVKLIGSNPTFGKTGIMITLVRNAQVRTAITNALGQQIATLADGTMNAGEHLLEWNASGVPAGVYFCTVSSNGTTTVQRIVVQ